jgi:5-carboxymethyl-2-hydroxymuconate isomerase
MPHVILEYSSNLDSAVDIRGLLKDLHEAVIESGIAEPVAVRSRAEPRDVFRVGDGDPKNAFVHVVARVRIGRPQDKLKAFGESMLARVERRMEAAFNTHRVAITVEIHEINHMTFRRNTVREHARSLA